MGLPKAFGSNFLSFGFAFRTAVLLGFGDAVGDGVEDEAAVDVGAVIAGEVGAVGGGELALQAVADATTNALAIVSDVRRNRDGGTTSLTIAPHADVPDLVTS